MPEPLSLWELRANALARARKAIRRREAEGLHDLRVALRRLSTTAGALGRDEISERAKSLVRSLSKQRQLEVDRALLTRVGRLGLLSPDATTALAARWEKLAERNERRIAKTAGRPVEDLVRRLDRLSKKSGEIPAQRLEHARLRAERALEHPLDGRDDRALHRYRLAVKKARYLAEDLAALGVETWKTRAEREKALQEALGRWNDLRLFCGRLLASRQEAEERGAVNLVRELERLLKTLKSTIADVRKVAIDASRAHPAGQTARPRRLGRKADSRKPRVSGRSTH